jgi:hypothetical protein
MNRWRLYGAVLAPLLMSLWLGACERCGGDQRAAVATLSTLVGSGVTRDYARSPRTWLPAELGAKLALGDGARTDAKSTAELTFVNGATLGLKPNTTIRLLADSAGEETGIDVQAGEAQLHSRRRALTLRTHVGLATIAAESDITLTRDGDTLGVHVSFGSVSFRDVDAGEHGLVAGDDVHIGIGMAVLDLTHAAKEPPALSELTLDVKGGEIHASGPAGADSRRLSIGRHALPVGAELRLVAGSEAEVTRGAQRATLRGAGEFVLGSGSALVESRRGQVSVARAEVEVEIKVPGGVIIARQSADGTSAELTVGAEQSQIAVARGHVTATIHGRTEELMSGSEKSWANREGEAAQEPGPKFHNVAARVGESFVVHAPVAPVAVALDFSGKCRGEGLVEQIGGRQASTGVGRANLSFGPGVRSYTVRCIAEGGAPSRIVARGSVQVLVDPGTRQLPPRAPTSSVEADGRTYTIYYQNQLPDVLVRWPNPPTVAKYVLALDDKPIELAEPQHVFRSGALTDGVHRLEFQAEGRRSRTTTVEVRFDNVAPKASLSAPEERGFAAGDLVTVEGVALPTWKVTLEGGTIAMLRGDRFTGQVQTSKERPDIAVRLSHPRLGTHYYLRRASDSP